MVPPSLTVPVLLPAATPEVAAPEVLVPEPAPEAAVPEVMLPEVVPEAPAVEVVVPMLVPEVAPLAREALVELALVIVPDVLVAPLVHTEAPDQAGVQALLTQVCPL